MKRMTATARLKKTTASTRSPRTTPITPTTKKRAITEPMPINWSGIRVLLPACHGVNDDAAQARRRRTDATSQRSPRPRRNELSKSVRRPARIRSMIEYVIPSNDAAIIQTAIAPDSRPALNRPPVPHPMAALTQMIKTMIATKPHTQASYRAAYGGLDLSQRRTS